MINADFQVLRDWRNVHNVFARKLGITVREIGPGTAFVEKRIEPDDVNPVGGAHGGCLFTIADAACGAAVSSYGYQAVTLSADYHFLHAGAVGDLVTAKAAVIRHGAAVTVCGVELRNQQDRLLGSASMTFYTLDRRLEL